MVFKRCVSQLTCITWLGNATDSLWSSPHRRGSWVDSLTSSSTFVLLSLTEWHTVMLCVIMWLWESYIGTDTREIRPVNRVFGGQLRNVRGIFQFSSFVSCVIEILLAVQQK